ncbi:MAG: hypothetical protein CMG60_07975 [Candidatus Marinimicrobia bacterium]|nr:hypothetical protein [Candidatus Neomarinimicrobiota bacterium]
MAEKTVFVVRVVVLTIIQRKDHVVRLGRRDDIHDVPVVVVRPHQNRRVWDDLVVVTNRGLKPVFKVNFHIHIHGIVTGGIDGAFIVTERFGCGSGGTHQVLNSEGASVRVTVVTLLGEVYKGDESSVNHVERLGRRTS